MYRTRWSNSTCSATRRSSARSSFVSRAPSAAFTGLYFAISMLTDDVYRREFLDELTSEMRESFRQRAEYLRLQHRATLHKAARPHGLPRHRRHLLRPRARRRAGRQAGADRRPQRAHDHLRRARRADQGPGRRPRRARLRAGRHAVRLHAEPARVRRRLPRRRPRRRQAPRPQTRSTRLASFSTSSRTRARRSCSRSRTFLETATKAAEGAGVEDIFVLGEADGRDFAERADWAIRPTRPRSTSTRDDLAVLPYSSGTTGPAEGRDAHAQEPRLEPRPDPGCVRRSPRTMCWSESCPSSTSTGRP